MGHAPGDVLDASPAIVEAFDQIQTADGRANHHVTAGNRHFDVRATPLTDERGDRRGTVVVFHDVTEREANRWDLEHQNEQLDRFASVVSHDLRNPLSIAEGYLELARESGEDDHFEAVQEAHERMHAIIEDVLTLARDGATIETRSRVSLARVADGAWDHVDTDGAELVVDDVAISADPDRLQRLFENCFRNSIEHGVTSPDADASHDACGEGTGDDSRSGVLTVRVGPIEPDDPDSLQSADAFGFYVADDGTGIPPEALDTVFEPGHSSSEDGTGLGLSIVQGIAEAHGWSVRATNVEDGGARFEFTGASPVSRADAAVEPMTDGAQR